MDRLMEGWPDRLNRMKEKRWKDRKMNGVTVGHTERRTGRQAN